MEKKTVYDLRAHLSLFQPCYPILKGYVARLLSHDPPLKDVIAEILAIAQAAVPGKECNKGSILRNVYFLKRFITDGINLTQQWSSLTELFLQPFPVTFKSLPVSAAASQPGHSSSAQHPEPTPVPLSVTPLEPDTQQATLTQSSTPLSVTPLKPDLIMEKKTVHDLKAHLSLFKPGYPILKGYVAKLLSHDPPLSDVIAEVLAIVRAAVPGKQCKEKNIERNVYALKMFLKKARNLTQQWSSLTELLLQPIPVTFKSLPVSAGASQPGHASLAQYSEPTPVPLSVTPLEPDTQQATLTQSSAPLSVTQLEPGTSQTTLTQSSTPLSATPLEPDLIMEKKTVHDLKAHLSLFKPGYPILKGYVAKLLSHDPPVIDVVAEILAIVQAAVPEKRCNKGSIINNVYGFKRFMKESKNLTQQWSSLTELFLQPFPVKFNGLPVSAAASQPGHSSSAQHPEPTPVPLSVTQLEPGTSQTTLTQSSTPLSVAPLEPELIMEKKTVHDLRAHLSLFQPWYPILKGYVARLLNDDIPVNDVVAVVLAIVQAAVPEKKCNEGSVKSNVYIFKRFMKDGKNLSQQWSSLTELFLQPFPITFKSLPVSAGASQPGHTLAAQHAEPTLGHTSPAQYPEPMLGHTAQHPEPMFGHTAQHPEPIPVPLSVTPLETDNSKITLEHFPAPVNLPSFSGSCTLPPPKKLRQDCPNCMAQECKVVNVTQENKHLQQQINQMQQQINQMQYQLWKKDQERPMVPLKRLNETIKRKTQMADKWKTYYMTLKEEYEAAKKSVKSLIKFKEWSTELQMALNISHEQIRSLTASNHRLQKMLEKKNKKVNSLVKKRILLKRQVNLEVKMMQKQHTKELFEVRKSCRETVAYLDNKVAILEEEQVESRNNGGD